MPTLFFSNNLRMMLLRRVDLRKTSRPTNYKVAISTYYGTVTPVAMRESRFATRYYSISENFWQPTHYSNRQYSCYTE